MLQEDSNSEGFEIIDKKNGDSSNGADKTESLSSVSSAYSIPSPSLVNIPASGNLLSNIPPPSALPSDLTLWQAPKQSPVPSSSSSNTVGPNVVQPVSTAPEARPLIPPPGQPFIPPVQFSAAIPPSKGIQHGPSSSQAQNIPEATAHGGGFLEWMKDAVSTGGILSKVAEKAKHSIDSVITTLDPQMSEFIYSGGDIEIAIISQETDDIVPIRDAIYSVFGKAWVSDASVPANQKKSLSIGFEDGFKCLEDKLNTSLQIYKTPTIGIETIILNQNDQWFTLHLLMLKDPEKQIKLVNFSHSIPIPLPKIVRRAEKEMPEYAKLCESTEKLLASYFQKISYDWEAEFTGVSKKESILTTAKVLLNSYKGKLVVND